MPGLLYALNRRATPAAEPVPWLAALVCCSAFDLALHDAYGMVLGRPIYETYTAEFLNADLSHYLLRERYGNARFDGRYPADYLVAQPPSILPAWHLIGGKDPLDESELTGSEPDDGYPVLLRDWIRRDGLKCLKVKLRGDDDAWDHERLLKVGKIAIAEGVNWLTADFNCTVHEPSYVNTILDHLLRDQPRLYGMILYVEQPFPYELEQYAIDVHSVSARKPLFMDESAHDWHLIRLGRGLGWSGVALKTCKTQTGALLSLCWAKAHGMTLMVQDLSNPMFAQIPHVLLAAHAGTIMGVETNGMQFYPHASRPEAAVHAGLYRHGRDASTWRRLAGPASAIGSARFTASFLNRRCPAAANDRLLHPAIRRRRSTMSDFQTVWTIIWNRASRSSAPGEPFEMSGSSPRSTGSSTFLSMMPRSSSKCCFKSCSACPRESDTSPSRAPRSSLWPSLSMHPRTRNPALSFYPLEL